MANLDVSELIADPDFSDTLILINRQYTINDLGENSTTSQEFCTVGSVQPVDGKTLSRLPDDLRIADVRSFWLRGTITTDGRQSKYPDLIKFKGDVFSVQMVFPWTNFGTGFSEGVCVRERPS